jgi:hypothetical protein
MFRPLRDAKVVKSTRVLSISEANFPGLGDSYGPGAEVYAAISKQAEETLGGIILLDDLDRLASLGEGRALSVIGTKLATIARAAPGRMLIIATCGDHALETSLPSWAWIREMHVKTIPFPEFSPDVIKKLTIERLEKAGLKCSPEAVKMLGTRSRDLHEDVPGDFDNAYAVRRFVGRIRDNQANRLRRHPRDRAEITSEDIQHATAKVV